MFQLCSEEGHGSSLGRSAIEFLCFFENIFWISCLLPILFAALFGLQGLHTLDMPLELASWC